MDIKQVLRVNMKAVIAVILMVLVGIAAWYIISNREPTFGSYTVSKGDIISTVDIPGTVASSNSVDLSFQESGKISAMHVKEGQAVTQGQALASLDSATQSTELSQQQAALANAEANYNKLVAGTTVQNIQTSKDAVNSAHQNLVNAYNGAINTLNSGYTTIYNAYNVVVLIQKHYFTNQDSSGIAVSEAEDDINANMQSIQNSVAAAQKSMAPADIDTAITKMVSVLNSTYNDVNTIRSQCDQGAYYYVVTVSDKASLDTQKTDINSALSATTALQQNTASLTLSLQTAQDQLNVTTAPPTQSDIDAAKAQIASAQAQINNAQLLVGNATIVAPFSGIVRNVVGQTGMVVSPNDPILSIINNQVLKINAYASQTDVQEVPGNAMATVVLDAYGNGVTFPAKVTAVDTQETVMNGSPAYHVTLYFTGPNDRLRAGMTGSVLIISTEHDNVIKIPSHLVFDDGGHDFVLIQNGKSSIKRQVTLGLTDSNSMVEVVSGLVGGEKLTDF
jgi:RND family efflux transporter MFP subunit